MLTDLEILRTLEECGPAPMPVFLLAERSGLPVDRMTLRMKSLVSLRYVERLAIAEAESYALAPAATCPSLAPHLMTGAPGQPNGRRRVEGGVQGAMSHRTRTNGSTSGA